MPFKEGAAASRLVSEVEISEMEISEVEISEVEISEVEISDTGTLGRRWSFSTTPSSRLVQYRERAAPPSCAQSCAQFFFWLRTQRILHIHVTVGRRFSQQQALDLFVGRPCCVCRLLSAARHRARRQHRRAVRSPCMHDRLIPVVFCRHRRRCRHPQTPLWPNHFVGSIFLLLLDAPV